MKTEVTTNHVLMESDRTTFGEVPYGTTFIVAEVNAIYLKTTPLMQRVVGGMTEVNAVNVKSGVGVWFSDNRTITPYTQAVYWR